MKEPNNSFLNTTCLVKLLRTVCGSNFLKGGNDGISRGFVWSI